MYKVLIVDDQKSSRELLRYIIADSKQYEIVGTLKDVASDFTKQELAVLQMKVNGYSHQEICEKLHITRSTLNYHIANLKGKTGYENILKLAIDVSMKKFMIAEN